MLYWVTGAVLLVYLLLVWFLAGVINPPGAGIWVLRVGLWLIGILAAAITVWWLRRRAKEAAGSDISNAPSAATSEVDLLVREAVRKLKASPMGRGASLGNLPLIFLMGDAGSAKTNTIVHSALDPELLAGQVYQDNAILPTRMANFWYTRQAVFVDGGGSLFSSPDLWRRLIKLVQPGRIVSAGGRQQAPRAAIVCFDCEAFLRPGAPEATLSTARRLGTRLLEISQTLGISFPIYVLFTKADRIGTRADRGSAFLDYVAGLSKDESSQVLGVTLPVRSLQASGVYADEETKRLEKAFDELFYSLAEKRVDLLANGNSDQLPGIYEFPRELRKLRKLIVQFLVDLARPSQLNVNPFLRGFYFSGIRPTVIEDVASAMPEVQTPEPAFDGNATVVFGANPMRAAQPMAAPRVSGSRKVPEWTFLSQLFNEVILKDRVALSASSYSSGVSLLRRVVLASVIGISLIFAIGFFTSFLSNYFLERTVKQAVDNVRTIHAIPGQTPSVDQLQKLDDLRKQLETLSSYSRDGAPWHLRWWMYSGDDLYPAARQSYFDQFGTLMFFETQGRLLTALRSVKDKPDPTDSYESTYNALKAYLITTSNPDKSTKEFLTPVLYTTWATGKTGDDQTAALARSQFDYYAGELLVSNPYSSSVDAMARDHARYYLQGFVGVDRYYLPLKADVSRKVQSASFARQFRDALDVINSGQDVEGAFTPEGFSRMQDAIAHNRVVNEEWVVGKQTSEQLGAASLQQQLTDRYISDFIGQWRSFLQRSSIRGYAGLRDADTKLGRVISPSSPLLELFWFVSHYTNVPQQQIKDSFQPVQSVVPDGPPSQYIGPTNQPYVDALNKLRSQVELVMGNPNSANDPTLSAPVLGAAVDAKGAVAQLSGKFRPDPQFHIESTTQNLLQQPPIYVEALLKTNPKDALNGAGRAFCSDFAQISSKFPFNPSSSLDAPLDAVSAMLAPNTGKLWQFYNAKLTSLLTRQGTQFVANPAANPKPSPEFVTFFNRAAALSDALYAGSPAPHLSFTLKQFSTNLDALALKIGADTLSGTGQTKAFTWTGAPAEIQVTTKEVPINNYVASPWSVFRFFNDGHPQNKNATTTEISYTVRQSNGQEVLKNGQREFYTYDLQMGGASALHFSDFSGLSCVSTVAR